MGLALVDRLGTQLDRRWREDDYDPRHFPDAAVEALTEARLPEGLRPEEVIDWVLQSDALPRQMNLPATFGQPPVTLFRARHFYIEALFWIDGSTTIHQHAFSGAFQVLAGSSIETRYSFEPARTFDGHFVLGSLRVESTAYLRPGDVRPISSGLGRLIHSLFHLERPSVTIVARTFRDADAGPQFDFSRPGVGHDPFYKEDTLDRTLEVVGLLRNINAADFEEKVGELLGRTDLHTAYRVLRECAGISDRASFDRLVDRVRDREAAATFRLVFEEARRLRFLITRRALVREPELRFFLGALLNTHRRRDLLALALARVPAQEPATQIARWLRGLSELKVSLQAAGVPWQPNLLGLPEMNDELERVLAVELAEGPPTGDETALRFLSELRAIPALAALFGS